MHWIFLKQNFGNYDDVAMDVKLSPKLAVGEEARRSYTIYGKTNLTDAAWHSPTNASSRFFHVGVEMR